MRGWVVGECWGGGEVGVRVVMGVGECGGGGGVWGWWGRCGGGSGREG